MSLALVKVTIVGIGGDLILVAASLVFLCMVLMKLVSFQERKSILYKFQSIIGEKYIVSLLRVQFAVRNLQLSIREKKS